MVSATPTVYLLDDEPGLVKAVTRLLKAENLPVKGYLAAADFLAELNGESVGCLVLDAAMPDLDGFAVQERLLELGNPLPVIFLTGRGDIPMSVRAIKAGAVDFLTKPVNDAHLLRAVREGLDRAPAQRAAASELLALRERYQTLTPREREVMHFVVTGLLNKQIAAEFGTGEQNIKVHRGRAMEKMGVVSLADLVRAAERLGVGKGADSH